MRSTRRKRPKLHPVFALKDMRGFGVRAFWHLYYGHVIEGKSCANNAMRKGKRVYAYQCSCGKSWSR